MGVSTCSSYSSHSALSVFQGVVVERQAIVMYRRGSIKRDLKIVPMQVFTFGGAEQGEVGGRKMQILFADFDRSMHGLSLSLPSL